MPKRMYLAEKWDAFARAVFPLKTSALQRKEMRRAFYAGAQMMLLLVEEFTPDGEATNDDVAKLEAVHEELQEFAKALMENRA